MNLDFLYPVAGNHAVQTMAFVVEWQGELSEEVLHSIHALAPQLKSHFPSAALQKLVTVNIGAPGQQASSVSNSEALGGVQFVRANKFGQPAGALTVSRNNLSITVNDYTRWKTVLEAAMRFFKIVLTPIMDHKAITAVALQYVDLFTWKDSAANLDYREVFKDTNPYLPPNVLTLKNLWHSHHGFMVETADPVPCVRLDNINVDVLDSQSDRVIQITTSHRASVTEPLRKASNTYLQDIEAIQNALHVANKEILKALLSEAVSKKILLVDN